MTDSRSSRDRIVAGLRSADRWEETLAELGRLSGREIEPVIDRPVASALVLLLGDPSRTRQRRTADVCAHLAPAAPELQRALESALGALDPRLRWGAAYTLGHTEHPPSARLWPAVRETLSLEDGDQRWAAAELTCALASEHPSVRDDVVDAAQTGSATMRRMLLYCLRDMNDPSLTDIATARLSDPEAGVRLAALAALATVEREDAPAPALADRIAKLMENDSDAGVRRAAAAALGKLGTASPESIAALTRAQDSADQSLARAAKNALSRLPTTTSEG